MGVVYSSIIIIMSDTLMSSENVSQYKESHIIGVECGTNLVRCDRIQFWLFVPSAGQYLTVYGFQ